jgi:hypothetical protein
MKAKFMIAPLISTIGYVLLHSQPPASSTLKPETMEPLAKLGLVKPALNQPMV